MNLREKCVELVALMNKPVQQLIDETTLDGFEGVSAELLPEPVMRMMEKIKASLTETREAHDDAVAEVVKHFLSEEEVDILIAYEKSDLGRKTQQIKAEFQNALMFAETNWRNAALEPHIDEIKKIMGVEEPAPIDEPLPSIDEPPSAA